ncbi:uncharacterized protein LOC115620728 isoform X2 [Scaptodrosophila lebanonensis]|uniref:Uncharacterized protein LOC115620728 isoform X2 n=1 Tax=Drosophila lebanonensis TaxID=7225 RepID=A0A6J2T1T6_DROLE|nr:uncharacterized protein LOC115620728 isoform X2 [Scaptodrosophila lebanonensis]
MAIWLRHENFRSEAFSFKTVKTQKIMNIYVLFSLLFFLAPGGCPIYSIDLSTLEAPNPLEEQDGKSELRKSIEENIKASNYEANFHEIPETVDTEEAKERIMSSIYDSSLRDPLEEGDTQDSEEQPLDPDQSAKVYRSAKDHDDFLGTNLFGNYPKKCFSTEDIALMSARKDFEAIIPKSYPQCLLSDSVIYMLMKYFNSINQIVKRMSDEDTRRLLQRAFYDTMGGYLRYYLIPVAQVSYYAGRLKLCTVERLLALYEQCKLVLNTNGNGWKAPASDILSMLRSVNIKPVKLGECKGSENDAASCAMLDQICGTKDAQDDLMIVSVPRLEPEDRHGYLSNVFLPFKQRRIFNLQAKNSAFILVKFFQTVTNCYRFQGMTQKVFNLRFRTWIRECVQMHYKDEMFYPGLGGVLQINEYLSCPKKKPQSIDEQEPVSTEEDSKDYEASMDDIENDGEKCPKVNNKADKKNVKNNIDKKNVDAQQSKKKSRSAKLDHEVYEKGALEGKKEKPSGNAEECIECDDENYVAYIAAFLALLLVLLLFLICCCMRMGRKHKDDGKHKRRRERVEPMATKSTYDEESAPKQPPPPVRRESPASEPGCCSTLFRSRRHKNSDRNKMQRTGEERTPTGMRFTDEAYARPLNANEREKFQAYERYTDGSFTSSSSLTCQFPRKCIPMPFPREKRPMYYSTSERKRQKPRARSSVWDRDLAAKRFEENEKMKPCPVNQSTPPASPQKPQSGQTSKDLDKQRYEEAKKRLEAENRQKKAVEKKSLAAKPPAPTKPKEVKQCDTTDSSRGRDRKVGGWDAPRERDFRGRESDNDNAADSSVSSGHGIQHGLIAIAAGLAANCRSMSQEKTSEEASSELSELKLYSKPIPLTLQSTKNSASWQTTFDDES